MSMRTSAFKQIEELTSWDFSQSLLSNLRSVLNCASTNAPNKHYPLSDLLLNSLEALWI